MAASPRLRTASRPAHTRLGWEHVGCGDCQVIGGGRGVAIVSVCYRPWRWLLRQHGEVAWHPPRAPRLLDGMPQQHLCWKTNSGQLAFRLDVQKMNFQHPLATAALQQRAGDSAWRLTLSALASLVSTPFIHPLQGERLSYTGGPGDDRLSCLTVDSLSTGISSLRSIHPSFTAELSSLPTSRDTIQGRTRKLTLLPSGGILQQQSDGTYPRS
ncbi:hypothetical protein BDA96_01G377900 [Sorghum bicolor]|uniref:Uncharacterized protein n=1 Tax=Sorghum bicolor TaxID=4558 RepID=A0A921S3Y6_SORBI|nr:hypothetical protein BDA96_01G377900 [Sorghum bicolor]